MKKLNIFLLILLSFFIISCDDDSKKSENDDDQTVEQDSLPDEDETIVENDEEEPDTDETADEENDQDADEITYNQTGGFYIFTTKEDGGTPEAHFVKGEGGFFGISFSAMEESGTFAVGAHYAAETPFDLENGTGKVYIFERGTIPETYENATSVLMHPLKSKYAGFGYTISNNLCDINGDGNKDFAVSSHLDSVGGKSSCGSIIVFYGNSENSFTNENQVKQIYISDELRSDRDSMGQSIACFDIDNDGYDDIIAGGQNAGADLNPGSTGMAAIFEGSENGIGENEAFTIVPALQESQQYFGSSIAIYDFNQDGRKDIAIGGWGLKEDENDVNRGGVFIYSGANIEETTPVSRIFPDSLEKIMFGAAMKVIEAGEEKYLAVLSDTKIHLFSFENTFPESSSEKTLEYEESELSDFDYIPDFYGKNKGAIVAGSKYSGNGGTAVVFKYNSETKSFETGVLFVPQTVVSSDGYGSTVKNIGDIDGDGLKDFVIGTPEHMEEE